MLLQRWLQLILAGGSCFQLSIYIHIYIYMYVYIDSHTHMTFCKQSANNYWYTLNSKYVTYRRHMLRVL